MTYYLGDGFEVRDGVSTTWVMAGGSRLAKIEDTVFAAEILTDLAPLGEPDGVITAGDAYLAQQAGASEEEVLKLLAASSKRMLVGAGLGVTYLHQNHQGSTALETDETGAVVARVEHYPYGERRTVTNFVEDYSYTGQERDRSTGLSYHSARYLDVKLGRWVSPDPLFASLGKATMARPGEAVERYGYVGGNPVNATDPSGEAVCGGLCIAGVAAGLAFAFKSSTDSNIAAPIIGGLAGAAAGGAALSGVLAVGRAGGGAVVAETALDAGQVAYHGVGVLLDPSRPANWVELGAATADLLTGPGVAAEVATSSRVSRGGVRARFIGEPNGELVDIRTTPAGSYRQPSGGRTDVLQPSGDHGAGYSHTHDPRLNTNPTTGKTFQNGLTKPGRAVSSEDIANIQSGAAAPASPKGR